MSKIFNFFDSNEYRDVTGNIAQKLKIKIIERRNSNKEKSIIENVEKSKLNLEDINKIFIQNRNEIEEFSISKIKFFEKIDDKQEFPKGEELGEENKEEVLEILGYSEEFLINNIIEYIIIKSYLDYLEEYLKLRRIPQAKKYAKQLKKIYDDIRSK